MKRRKSRLGLQILLGLIVLIAVSGCLQENGVDTNKTTDNNTIDENNQIDVNLINDTNNYIIDQNKPIEPKVRIELDKEKYKQGEEVKVKVINEIPEIPVYLLKWWYVREYQIFKFENDDWKEINFNPNAPYICLRNMLKNVPTTAPSPGCTEIKNFSIKIWNQKYYFEKIEKCNEKDYSTFEERNVEPGLYKARVCYFTNNKYCSYAFGINDIEEKTCLEKEFEIEYVVL